MEIAHGIESLCDTQLLDFDAVWNTTTPELSACFHETIIVWIPAFFLWLCVPYAVFDFFTSRRSSIPWNWFNITRQLLSLICTVTTFIECLLCLLREYQFDDSPTSSHLISTAIQFITKLLLSSIIYFHRISGVHSSGIVWLYLLFDSILGAFSIYSYSLIRQKYEFSLFMLQYACTVLLLIICSFSDKLSPSYEKLYHSDNPKSKVCPKETASFPSKLTFWWFNQLAINGWRHTLTNDDLWGVRVGDKCENIYAYFHKYWKTNDETTKEFVVGTLGNGNSISYPLLDNSRSHNSNAKHKPKQLKDKSVLLTIAKVFWFYFLPPNIMKLGSDILLLANPMILKLLIGFASDLSTPSWHGYVYAALFCLTNVTQSMINSYHAHRMAVLGIRIRTCLISSVYRKSLVLSNTARKDATTGEIVNLMSVDAQRFIDLLPWLSFLWSAPIQIGIALWLLYAQLNYAVFGGLAVMIAFIPISGSISAVVKKFQTKQMKFKDQRLKILNEVLNGIKVIKLYAWENAFIDSIFSIRTKELNLLKKSGYFSTIFVTLSSTSAFVVSFVTFAIYILVDDSHVLDAEKAFVSIALFNLIRIPLVMFPNMITSIILTMVSVKRLNNFLNSSELSEYVTRNDDKNMVVIENGSFTWNRVEDLNDDVIPHLNKVNLRVKNGQFVAIVGSVGSGKSSMIMSILGEMEKVDGHVNIKSNSSIAYVPQQAWIQNNTLRDNILFGEPYDALKYKKTINSCALKQDLSVLAAGDTTEIGEKGINLSGGQKQRVSLARACYSDADLFLLDDPLSAVDSHVAKHIFDEVLSSKSGMLQNKTRILVTNSLFVLPNVDLIVVMKDGRINDIGTYDDLMSKSGDFAELINQYSSSKAEELSEPEVEKSGLRPRLRHSSSVFEPEQKPIDASKLVEEERAETGQVKFEVYKKYMNALTPFWAISMIVSYMFVQAFNAGSSFWLSAWTQDDDKSVENTRYSLGIYGLIGFSQAIFIIIGWLSMTIGCLLASGNLHKKLLIKIMHAPMSFFDTTPMGRVLNRFSKDIDVLDTLMSFTIRVLLSCTFQVIATLVVISSQTPIFLAVVFPLIILYYFIQKFYVATSRQLRRLESIARSPIYNHFSETLNGVSTIRAYNVRERFVDESNTRVDNNQMCFYPSQVSYCWLQIRLEFISNLIIFCAALFAVLGRNDLNPGVVGLSISYSLSVTLTLNWCVRMFADMESNVVAVERVDEYSNIDSEADWNSNNKPPNDWPQNGLIDFDQYATKYREGMDLVLKGIDVHVNKGEKIGIVGRTGAGKSSLTLALFRLIEATYGKIIIDGINISNIGLHELRSKLTIIPQDPVLFSGTLRTNLDPFNSYTDEQIWLSLEHSHLKSFVANSDIGLEYKVSENGDNLSVGQRQLICLARALLRNTKILILDEATAAIDLETDALIQTTIRTQFVHCTVLTIAHRLHTIIDSDRVLVLDAGRVAEFASPQQLLKDERSLFYSLAKDAGIV